MSYHDGSNVVTTFIITISLVFNTPIYAYIGPGMRGGGVIATILGIIGSIFLAISGIL